MRRFGEAGCENPRGSEAEKRKKKTKEKKRKISPLTVRDRRRDPGPHREREAAHEVRPGLERVVEGVEVMGRGRGAEVADVLAEGVDGGSCFFFWF